MTTTSPGFSSGTSTWSTWVRKAAPLKGPSSTKGATTPVRRSPATKVGVFQCPCGTPARRRSPLGARPWVRAILVVAQVSSTKTGLAGSRSGRPSNHARRRLGMSGRSCSAACAVLFSTPFGAARRSATACRCRPAPRPRRARPGPPPGRCPTPAPPGRGSAARAPRSAPSAGPGPGVPARPSPPTAAVPTSGPRSTRSPRSAPPPGGTKPQPRSRPPPAPEGRPTAPRTCPPASSTDGQLE